MCSVQGNGQTGRLQEGKMTCERTIEDMKDDLYSGGWELAGFNGTLWRSPSGVYYLGPHKAWHIWAGTPMCDPNQSSKFVEKLDTTESK